MYTVFTYLFLETPSKIHYYQMKFSSKIFNSLTNGITSILFSSRNMCQKSITILPLKMAVCSFLKDLTCKHFLTEDSSKSNRIRSSFSTKNQHFERGG